MKHIVTLISHTAMLFNLKFLKLAAVISLASLAAVEGYKGQSEIRVEGNIAGHDVILGSNINLTCLAIVSQLVVCDVSWYKDNVRLNATVSDDRIYWILAQRISADRCSTSKVMIKNFTVSDVGTYACVAMPALSSFGAKVEESTLDLFAVSCHQGYYCPTDNVPQRCPFGTFSLHKNATSIKNCSPCPVDVGKRQNWKRVMKRETFTMFQTNCQSSTLMKKKTPSVSSEAKIVTTVLSLVAALIVVLGILYGIHRRKVGKYRENLLSPSKEIDYDPPKLPRSKDVFVCYSSKNRQWVHDVLFPNLKSQDFKVFIDFVDFEIGKTIDDNIVKGINGSRKTLFILSKDSLKSLYARKELYHALAAGKTGHQVLVILYEKCKAPAEIIDIVYLDWTDTQNRDRFWERLYNAIRRPLANEIVNV